MPRPARAWHLMDEGAIQRVQFHVRAGVMARLQRVQHEFPALELSRDELVCDILDGCMDIYVDNVLRPRLEAQSSKGESP